MCGMFSRATRSNVCDHITGKLAGVQNCNVNIHLPGGMGSGRWQKEGYKMTLDGGEGQVGNGRHKIDE